MDGMFAIAKRYGANRPGCKPILVVANRLRGETYSGRNIWKPMAMCSCLMACGRYGL